MERNPFSRLIRSGPNKKGNESFHFPLLSYAPHPNPLPKGEGVSDREFKLNQLKLTSQVCSGLRAVARILGQSLHDAC